MVKPKKGTTMETTGRVPVTYAGSTTQGFAAQKLPVAPIHLPKAKREQLTNDVNNEVARASRGGERGPRAYIYICI